MNTFVITMTSLRVMVAPKEWADVKVERKVRLERPHVLEFCRVAGHTAHRATKDIQLAISRLLTLNTAHDLYSFL